MKRMGKQKYIAVLLILIFTMAVNAVPIIANQPTLRVEQQILSEGHNFRITEDTVIIDVHDVDGFEARAGVPAGQILLNIEFVGSRTFTLVAFNTSPVPITVKIDARAEMNGVFVPVTNTTGETSIVVPPGVMVVRSFTGTVPISRAMMMLGLVVAPPAIIDEPVVRLQAVNHFF